MPLTSLPSAPPDSEKTALAQRVILLLDRLSRLSRELQFVDGLNPAQWEALRFVARANRYSRTPTALAEYLGSTKGTVSQTLIALENKGLITRCKKTCDRRQVELCVTEAGEAMLARDPMRTLERAAAAMADDLAPHLVKGLSRLLHDLQNRHQVLEFGVCHDCSLFCVNGAQTRTGECGATGDAISTPETKKICVNYKATG